MVQESKTATAVRVLAAASVLVGALSGCIDSKCYKNSDCGNDRVCQKTAGVCVTPQCSSDSGCAEGQYCEDYVCKTGCLGDADCPAGEKCVKARCTLYRADCDCQAAPDFCQVDQNPASATFGQQLCRSTMSPAGAVLFFGSVACPHCQDVFAAARKLQESLVSDVPLAPLLFIQLKDVVITSTSVENLMPDATEPVVQDTEDLGIWDAYGADWYYIMVADRNGCLSAQFGPLTPDDLEGQPGQQLAQEWVAGAMADCLAASEPDPTDGQEDAVADSEPEILTDVNDAADLVPETAEDQGSDPLDLPLDDADSAALDLCDCEDVAEIVEPFELMDICQIEESDPPGLGENVPHFLCKDMNTTSATYGQGVSDHTLKEIVWVAYFGSCT